MSGSKRDFPMSLPDISKMAALFSNQTRAAICGALMSGTAWTPGELARFARISKANATEQINKLVEGGVVKEQRQGRHRYLMIASEEMASLIEMLAQASGAILPSPASLNAHYANQAFYRGRTCYNHLAGELGIRLLQQMQEKGYVSKGFQLTEKGVYLLKAWGIKDPQVLEGKPCMDTTHRVFHLAGSLGNAICRHLLEAGWIVRNRQSRCVTLTEEGRHALEKFQIDL